MQSGNLSAPGSRFSIETATWRDLSALRRLEQVCFPQDAWPLWDLVGVLTVPNVVRLKAVLDGKMAGFIAGDWRRSDGIAWISTVGVLPEYRRQGLGRALIEACEQRLVGLTIRLSVRSSNQQAIRLYESLGYHHLGAWPEYYQGGEDALVMEKGSAAASIDFPGEF
jgi:ribosomal protein S18 acetylase RimI-like enzyme